MPQTKRIRPKSPEHERARQVVQQYAARHKAEVAQASASLDMRDFEMAESIKLSDVGIATLSEWTGLTHAALYKAVRRGQTFREPPLPF